MPKINLIELETTININFVNKENLILSLTHKSHNSKINNERLEFIGDRVLGLIISSELLKIYPNQKVGYLDKMFASMVNKRTLLSIGKKIGLENCRIEGYESSDWKLVDAIDIIVHLFHPEKRSFYDLEKMWSENLPKEKALI